MPTALNNVSERDALLQALAHQADVDQPTGLPSRQALLKRLDARLASDTGGALLLLGSAGFKRVADSLGQTAHDELMALFVARLRRVRWPAAAQPDGGGKGDKRLRPWIARVGDAEFVLLVDGVHGTLPAAAAAEVLLLALGPPYALGGLEILCPVDLGLVLMRPHSTPDTLLRDGSMAMHGSRSAKPGGWLQYQAEMQETLVEALQLEGDLRVALRSGQIRPVYQPIVDMVSGRVVGMEALARWRHPQRSEVSPRVFVPLAERTGLIDALGEHMLLQAATQFAAWRQQGLALPARLSVNLSRAQLHRADLPERIAAQLARAGLPCDSLQLEITESLAMDGAAALAVLRRLRALGLQLALDDFGTGHSSLATLHRFPVQQIKLDRDFVREIETSRYHRALVRACVQVARVLKLELVVEGVETAGQAQRLMQLGCRRAQGWLYAYGLESAAVPAWLDAAAVRPPARR